MNIGQANDVMESLALMPDPALQQYAQLHKDDPYIMSLAMSESARRQKLRAAQQAQAGQMPQPKVVDQAIQGINPPPPQPQPPQGMPQGAPQQPPPQQQLPEQQGVARLPAPNMQGMADGGIVGYAPGGYAVGDSIPEGAIIMGNMYTDPNTGEKNWLPGAQPERTGMEGVTLGDVFSKFGTKIQDLLTTPYGRKVNAAKRQAALNAEQEAQYGPSMQGYRPRTVNPQSIAAAAAAPAPYTGDAGRGTGTTQTTPKLTTVSAPLADRLAAAAAEKAKAGAPSVAPPSAGAGISSLVTDPTQAAKQLADIQAAQKVEVPPELQNKIDSYGEKRRQALADEEAQRLKDIEATGTAFSDREARLKEKQGRIQAQEKDLGAMALMQAGFAMMSGTSPHALANIGAGATIGMKAYQEGLDKIENAKDKLDDAFGRIEEFRRNEQMMNAKDKRKYLRDTSETFADAEKMAISAFEKSWGVSRDDARTIYSGVLANQREAANQAFQAKENAANRANALAVARSNDPVALYRSIGQNPQGDVARGYAAAKQENTEPQLFATYEKMAADATPSLGGKYFTKGEEFRAKYPSVKEFVNAYRSSMGQGTMPAAGNSGITVLGSRPAK